MRTFVGIARDRSVGDDTVRQELTADGGPFLFGSSEPLSVGNTFRLAGNSFSVVRMIERSEFEHNAGRRLLDGAGVTYFFEAVTD